MDGELSQRVTLLMGAVIYPLWLIAGLVDYVSHRRTHIERTSGVTESWLHVLQFATLAGALALAILCEPTFLAIALIGGLLAAHTLLAFVDVAYTDGRRRIYPTEQHAHSFLLVLPLVAAALFAIQHWMTIAAMTWRLNVLPTSELSVGETIVLATFFIVGGSPVIEELMRTLRGGDSMPFTSVSQP